MPTAKDIEQEEKQCQAKDCLQILTSFICCFDLPGRWAERICLLISWVTTFLEGLKASRIITLIFALRDPCRINWKDGTKASLTRVSYTKFELASMRGWKRVQNPYFSLGLHFETPLCCRIHFPGLEREVASERSQNVWMKNEVIESIIHMLGLHAKHLHIWKHLGN